MTLRRRGVQALRHAVVENDSDHDAILVEFNFVNDDQVVRVKGGSWNIGKGSMDDLGLLLELLGDRGFLCLQEAGGQLQRIVGRAARHGYRLLGRTDLRGSASTIVLVGPEIKTRANSVHPLIGRRFVGRGAGPDHNKPKVANGGRLECDGVVFGVFSAHELASLQHPLRMRHGLAWARALTTVTFGKRVPWVVGADWNTDFRQDDRGLTEWLREHGWTTNHDELGDLATHGRRVIDGFGWRAADNIPAPKEPR